MGRSLKIVVVGDELTGKTSLLMTFLDKKFPAEGAPPVLDITRTQIKSSKGRIGVEFWDTSGSDDYDQIRPLCYFDTDIFIVCFDISNRTSFERVFSKWLPEIESSRHDVPKVVVGCKADVREASPHKITSLPLNLEKQLASSLK